MHRIYLKYCLVNVCFKSVYLVTRFFLFMLYITEALDCQSLFYIKSNIRFKQLLPSPGTTKGPQVLKS